MLNIPSFGIFEGQVAWADGEGVAVKFDEDQTAIVSLILEHVAGTAP